MKVDDGRLLGAILLIWSGIIIGVSFMDAPMKFQTPSLTLQIALDVGRTLFGLLHLIEKGFVVVSFVLVFLAKSSINLKIFVVYCLVIGIVLFEQLWIGPPLFDRIAMIVDGKQPEPSNIHLVYIVAEVIKVISLFFAASQLLKERKQKRN